jgi:flagellar protein FliS
VHVKENSAMVMKNPFSQYTDTQINTATPGRLIVLAYDGAIRFANTGMEAMKAGKLDVQSANITKVQAILTELTSSLDGQSNPELADSLTSLYNYMFDRLTEANIHDNAEALDEVINLLSDLRAAWAEAEMLVRSGRLSVKEAEAA